MRIAVPTRLRPHNKLIIFQKYDILYTQNNEEHEGHDR